MLREILEICKILEILETLEICQILGKWNLNDKLEERKGEKTGKKWKIENLKNLQTKLEKQILSLKSMCFWNVFAFVNYVYIYIYKPQSPNPKFQECRKFKKHVKNPENSKDSKKRQKHIKHIGKQKKTNTQQSKENENTKNKKNVQKSAKQSRYPPKNKHKKNEKA